MEIKEIIEAFEGYDWDFDCENCGVRKKSKKGYYLGAFLFGLYM